MNRLACLDDREVGWLALQPTGAEASEVSGVSGARASELLSHVESCELCRFAFNQRRQEALDLARVWKEGATPAPVKSAGSAPIVMRVYMPDSEPISQGTLLAAQGVAGAGAGLTGAGIEQGVTLAAEGHQFIMRVMRDSRTGELWLYLLSDDEGGAARVVVCPFGGDETFVTDERGRINMGVRGWPQEGALTAEVRHPLARFVMAPVKGMDQPDSSVVLTSERGDRIRVSLSGSEHGRKLSVMLLDAPGLRDRGTLRLGIREAGKGDGLRVEPLASGSVTVSDVGAAPEFELFLFA